MGKMSDDYLAVTLRSREVSQETPLLDGQQRLDKPRLNIVFKHIDIINEGLLFQN